MAFGIGPIDQLRAHHLQILGMASGIVPAVTLGLSQKHFPWHLHLWEWQLMECHCDHLTLTQPCTLGNFQTDGSALPIQAAGSLAQKCT